MNEMIEKYNQLTQREKIMLLVSCLVLVWGAWDKLFFAPLQTKKTGLNNELSTIEEQIENNKRSAMEVELMAKVDPNKQNKQTIQQLNQQLTAMKQSLGIGDKAIISAQIMATVLSDLLKQYKGLKLISLESLPVTSLAKTEKEHAGVYKHELVFSIHGSYLNILNYLKKMESLPWKFNWESLEFKVTDYPNAETKLKIYTLSFEENWLEL